jgi:multidrug efflux pump subunit AcrB
VAVLVSLVLALTIIPLLSERFLRPHQEEEEVEAHARRGPQAWAVRLGRFIDDLSQRYERSLAAVLHRPAVMVMAAGALIIGGIILQRFVGTGFLPEMDEGAFVLDYWSPGGTALDETDRWLKIAERTLAETPEVAGTSRRTGAELGLFATQQNRGDIVVRLKDRRDRSRAADQVIDEVRPKINQALPRLRIEFVQILSDVINDLAGAARPVEIKIFGAQLDTVEAYAKRLVPVMAKIPGLEDYFSGVSEPSAEMMLKVSAAEANRLGMTPEQVGDAVSGPLLGVKAGEIRLDDRSVAVRVRAPDSVRYDPLRLGSLPVLSRGGRSPVPLGTLASFRPTESRAELYRENQQQMIIATADVSGRSLGAIMRDVKSGLAANPPPAGVRIELGGQYAGEQQAFRALLIVLALAAVSVIAVMVIQFQSFIEPLIITLAAPVSFVGALILLMVTRTVLNVSSLMGLILLVGLIVKNGIILLDFTRRRMQTENLELEAAIREAARIRLRPILMTTLCTLFGLLPLALGLGAGSELQRPLALTVIGGLALSTPITLYVVPSLVVALRGARYRLSEDRS